MFRCRSLKDVPENRKRLAAVLKRLRGLVLYGAAGEMSVHPDMIKVLSDFPYPGSELNNCPDPDAFSTYIELLRLRLYTELSLTDAVLSEADAKRVPEEKETSDRLKAWMLDFDNAAAGFLEAYNRDVAEFRMKMFPAYNIMVDGRFRVSDAFSCVLHCLAAPVFKDKLSASAGYVVNRMTGGVGDSPSVFDPQGYAELTEQIRKDIFSDLLYSVVPSIQFQYIPEVARSMAQGTGHLSGLKYAVLSELPDIIMLMIISDACLGPENINSFITYLEA